MAQPVVKAIHKVEGTISDGDTSDTVAIGASVVQENTWVIMHHRCHDGGKADDHMVGYRFQGDDTLQMVRYGDVGKITCVFRLVEFEQGVRVQRGEFASPVDWNNVGVGIDFVDLDKTFLTLKVTAANDEFDGYDIVGEMWVRGKFADDSTIVLDHNRDTVGDSPEPVTVFWQVVEFDQGARVWSRDVADIDVAGSFKTADILDDLGLGAPPRPDQTFMVFSNRLQASSSGSSPRVDFWSMDGFLFNGTAGMWRGGGDVGEKKAAHIFIVELDFCYVESYHLRGHKSGVNEEQTIDLALGGVRDGANTVAFIPWNQWGGWVDVGAPISQKFFTTVEVPDKDTLRVKRGNGDGRIISMEVYVLEFEEPPTTESTGPLVIKRIASGQEDFVENAFGQKAFTRTVDLGDPVDRSKTIVWTTAHGHDTNEDITTWATFDDDQTLRLNMPDTDQDLTSIQWYLIEFESGVRVQRGSFDATDFDGGRHASALIDPVDASRAFVIGQWGEWGPHAAAWLSGSRQVRAFFGATGTGANVGATPSAWQVVELDNDGEVRHFGRAWEAGGASVEELGLGADWNTNSLFVWATEFLASTASLQHYDVRPDEGKVVVTRPNATAKGGTVIEVVDLGTFEGLVPQREHHFVQLEVDAIHIHEQDIALDHAYDVDNTVAWVPLAGNILPAVNNTTLYGGAVRLEMVGPSTLRAYASHENASFIDAGDQWEGYVYVLGFVPAPEGTTPEGPEGFYFGRLGGDHISKFGSTNRDA